MIVRLAIGVLLTAALVAVAAPAMSAASADAADSTVERQVRALSERLQGLVATNDPTVGPGARHVTTLRLPSRSLTSAGVDWLRLDSPEGHAIASWRVSESTTERQRLVGVPLRAPGGNLTLRDAGDHQLAFRLRSQSGRTVITVRRLGTGGR